jgi:hypothetical protein
MADSTYQARVTALSMAHGSALAGLLRAHGQAGHAEHLDAAMAAVFRIVSTQVGPNTLAEAMRWIAEEAGRSPNAAPPNETRH